MDLPPAGSFVTAVETRVFPQCYLIGIYVTPSKERP
jgi:hypothetical protein